MPTERDSKHDIDKCYVELVHLSGTIKDKKEFLEEFFQM